jgi:hypothetical protein
VAASSKIDASRAEKEMRLTIRDYEYRELRRTIAIRGTVRIVLVPLTFVWWAGLSLVLVLFSELPVAALFPLAVLAAGFEAVLALHTGVERIGRYLQVAYEEQEEGGLDSSVTGLQPRWETTAMKVGPALPGGGADPLFTILFCCAAIVNLIPALLTTPTPIEIGLIAALHVAFAIRILRARAAAGRQRAVELARFRELDSRRRPPHSGDA